MVARSPTSVTVLSVANNNLSIDATPGGAAEVDPAFIYPATVDEKPVALVLARVRLATSVVVTFDENANLCTVSVLAEG